MQKEEYMRRALLLALNGMGHTSPNPMVGCVIVKDGRIIGEGWHEYCGGLHAERNAFKHCTEDAKGADLYVTLEPCCHYGKTPPCTEAIIEHQIARVFVGCVDPNPKVGGKGIQILRDHGIIVETGILEEECFKVNEVFFHYISKKVPYGVTKYAMTLDGKIASVINDSKWITSEEARKHVHGLRNRYSGILVGIDTVLADNPMLNCRVEGGKDPVRIVCDSKLRIPLDCDLVKSAKDIPLIIACTEDTCILEKDKTALLINAGAKVIGIPADDNGHVDLKCLWEKLGELEIDSVLIEGGAAIHASALQAGIIQKVYAYIAPKIIGGADAKGPIGGSGIELMKDAVTLENCYIEQIGKDICISGYITPKNRKEEV